MKTLHPGGISAILWKSKIPSSAVYAEIIYLSLDCHSKFNANVHSLCTQQINELLI